MTFGGHHLPTHIARLMAEAERLERAERETGSVDA